MLNEDLSGLTILSIKHHEKTRYREGKFPNQDYITHGTKIKRIYGRCKKIIWILETPEGKEIYMVSFLGIHGHWLYQKENCTRISFELNDREIYYDDRDNKGTVQICVNKDELENVYRNFGPDLLTDDISLADYTSVIRNTRIKNKTIGSFLLEQKYFSGIGNIYRSEILYYAGIYPLKTLQCLSDKEIELLLYISKHILKFSYQLGGVSVMSYKDPRGNLGMYKPSVYGREISFFDHKVISIIEDERKIYYSPEIQN